VEANYFAGAVLAPEAAAVAFLEDATRERDLSVDDFREFFYVSYEMAAHRFTNLASRHLDLRTHFVRSDDQGVVVLVGANPRARAADEAASIIPFISSSTPEEGVSCFFKFPLF